jgi:hypothetical protein
MSEMAESTNRESKSGTQLEASAPKDEQGRKHEYLVWPVRDLDKKEQSELQAQIQSAAEQEPHCCMRSIPMSEMVSFWVVNTTPQVAEEIKNFGKVSLILSNRAAISYVTRSNPQC